MTASQLFIDTNVVSTIYMVRIRAPRLKNPPNPAIAPKLKVAKHVEDATESTVPSAALDKETPAPRLKAKIKNNVKGAFGQEKVKTAPKEKVKLTHNEKMAARQELRKTNKLKKKEALQAAKKVAKKAKRTALRNAAKRKAAGRSFTTE